MLAFCYPARPFVYLFVCADEVYSFEKGLGQGSMGAVAAIKKKSTGQMHVLKTIQVRLCFRLGLNCVGFGSE